MSGIMSEADVTAIGGRGGLGFGGSGIWDIIALVLVTNGGFFGNDRKDCCPRPATCESVAAVDRDVLETANEIQSDISQATHDIEVGLNGLGDKVTAGLYALNNAIKDTAYANQAATEAIKNKIDVGNTAILAAIKETAMNQEAKAQAAIICAQNEEINRYKIIEALKCCDKKSE